MYLKVDREPTRCERVIRQPVSPYVGTALSTCRIRSHEKLGEPVPLTLFLVDTRSERPEFRPFRIGTTWFELKGKIPVGMQNPALDLSIELDIDLGWHSDFAGGRIEGMVFRPDGTVIKAVHTLNAWVPLIGSARVDSAIAADVSFILCLESLIFPDSDTDTGIHDFRRTASASCGLVDTLDEASRVKTPILSDVPEIEPPVVLDSLQRAVVIWIKLADDGTGDLISASTRQPGPPPKSVCNHLRLSPKPSYVKQTPLKAIICLLTSLEPSPAPTVRQSAQLNSSSPPSSWPPCE